jgi:aminoglycoside phosphotransferase family enzyme/gluconate kinase
LVNVQEGGSLLIKRLMQPALFDHPVENMQLVETHISWVILTGSYAYKIKKPVDLGFLDFSTLEKRHFYCEEELRLNRRLAADYYLAVVPVTGTVEQPRWGGTAEVIEYAVKMRQFPQDAQLDRLLASGQVQPGYMDAFAELIANFHAGILVADSSSSHGSAEHVYQPVNGNFSLLEKRITAPELRSLLDSLRQWSQNAFSTMKALFRQRKEQGFVRECHGDMHLRNMAWINGRPLVFDCIEFNPELRWIDVISEIAFLVMDLMQRREPELAWRFLNAYLAHTGDYAGLRLLPFYLTYRAMVRAKIAAIRQNQADISAAESEEAAQELAGYLHLARQCSQRRKPMLLITRGLSASGKSTLSSRLLEDLGAIRVRSDVERKRLFGVSMDATDRYSFGEGIYSSDASRKTYEKLLQLAGMILDAGFPVIVDAAFLKAEQRKPFQMLAQTRGLPYVILELNASPTTLRERIRRRKNDVSDADLDVLERQFQSWEKLGAEEQPSAIAIDTEKALQVEALLRQIQLASSAA